MGWGSDLGDLLSGGGISAGREQRKAINNATGNVNTGYGNANQALNGQFSTAGGDISGAGASAQGQLASGFGQGQNYLNQDFSKAQGALNPLASQSAGAYSGLLDDTQAGKFDNNNFNFQEDPGYQFTKHGGSRPLRRV